MNIQSLKTIIAVTKVLFLPFILTILLHCTLNQTEKAKEQSIRKNARELNNKNISDIKEKVYPNDKITFIELGSVNCVPCKMMQPVMQNIEKKYSDQVDVVFHDVWTPEGKPYGQKFGIKLIPTQIFLDKEGKEYYRHEGFFAEDSLIQILQMKSVE